MVVNGGPSLEDLMLLASMVDRALKAHDRPAAVASAEHLLAALFRHHRALWPVRQRCDPATADRVEVETITTIAETALTIGTLLGSDRWPQPLLHHHVEELIEIETDRFAVAIPTTLP